MSILSIAPDLIDVWFIFYDEIRDTNLLDRYRRMLPNDERRQELRFHFPRDQIRYLVTRVAIRTVLSRYSTVKPEEWRFGRNIYGRPEISNEGSITNCLSFNISHTTNLIVLGVTSRHALGVDTENVRTMKSSLDLANSVFSPEEASALHAMPRGMQHDRFFDYWTLKESYIKAKGKGLSIPLDQFSFEFPDVRSIRVSFRPELNDCPARWRFWQVRPTASYLVAICVQRSQHLSQRLVTRKIVPLEMEEPLECTLLRQSD